MERIDLVITVLAVVAIAGSVAGLLTYQGGIKTFNVQFEQHELDPMEDSDTISGSGSTEFTFTVDQANLTQVEVETEVSTGDAVLTDRDVELELESPEGETMTDSGSISTGVGGDSVTLTAAVELADIPADHTEQAQNATELRKQIARDHRTMNGTGDWTVSVAIGGDAQDPATFDVETRLLADYFDAHVSTPGPDIDR